MSDDISIPNAGAARTAYTHSYRSRHSAGIDSGTRVLMMAAAGLGLVLLGGMTVWSFSGHRRAEGVPRIEADARPLRVKPDNPGGMNVSVFGDSTTGGPDAPSDLAPAAERPDPQALLAQRQQAAPPAISPPPALPAIADAAPVTATPIVAKPPAPAAKPGGIMVQLAAVASEAGATTEWQRLSHKLPDLLGSRQLVTQRAEQAGKPIWRVRTGGFTNFADATQFCKRLREKGAGCTLASF